MKKIITLFLVAALLLNCIGVLAIKNTSPNIALNKPARADSEYDGSMKPSMANDGNIWSAWSQGYSGIKGFWQVDLESEHFISSVTIYPRWDMDNVGSRRNFAIWLSNDPTFNEYEVAFTLGDDIIPYRQSLSIPINVSSKYRYVRFQKTVDEYSVLSEVMIYEANRVTDNFSAFEGKNYEKALKLLEYINVIDVTSFEEDSLVSRGEAVGAICKLIGADAENIDVSADKQVFYDVDSKHPYYNAIQLAVELGFISCNEDRMFYPNNYISTNELMKILLCGLGYKDLIEYAGGYPYGSLKYANDLKLLKGIKSSGDNFITSNDFCIALYNALNAPYLEKQYIADYVKFDDDNTLLHKMYNLTEASGIVTENQFSNLINEVSLSNNQIKIDGTTYTDATLKMQDLLGYKIDYFVDTKHDEMQIVLFAKRTDNSIEVLNGTDITSNSDNFANGKLEFISADNIKKDFNLTQGYSVIYNGIVDNDCTLSDLKKENTVIKLLDNNKDSNIDILYVESYTSFVIKSALNKNDSTIIQGEDDTRITLLNDSGCQTKITTLSGSTLEAIALESGDLVTVAQSKDGRISRVFVGDEIVSGIIKEILADTPTKVLIKDTYYEINNSYFKAEKLLSDSAKKIEVGLSGEFRLNRDNQIVAMRVSDVLGQYEYAFIAKIAYSNRLSGSAQMKIFRDNGNMKVFDLAKKVIIDGKQYAISEVIASGNSNNPLLKEGMVKIKFSGNLVREIDTTKNNIANGETKENSLDETMAPSIKALFYKASVPCLYISDEYRMYLRVNPASPVFTVPVDVSGKIICDTSSEKLFKVQRADAAFIDENTTKVYSYFDVDVKTKTPSVYLQHTLAGQGSAILEDDGPVLVVDKFVEGLDGDGTEVSRIKGFDYNGKADYIVDIDAISITGHIKPSELKTGDIIHYSLQNGKIMTFEIIFRPRMDKDLMETKPGLSPWYSTGWATFNQIIANTRGLYAILLNKEKALISVSDRIPTNGNADDIFTRTEVFSTENKPVYICSKDLNRLYEGEQGDLDNYLYTLNPNGRIFVVTARADVKLIIAYDF